MTNKDPFAQPTVILSIDNRDGEPMTLYAGLDDASALAKEWGDLDKDAGRYPVFIRHKVGVFFVDLSRVTALSIGSQDSGIVRSILDEFP